MSLRMYFDAEMLSVHEKLERTPNAQQQMRGVCGCFEEEFWRSRSLTGLAVHWDGARAQPYLEAHHFRSDVPGSWHELYECPAFSHTFIVDSWEGKQSPIKISGEVKYGVRLDAILTHRDGKVHLEMITDLNPTAARNHYEKIRIGQWDAFKDVTMLDNSTGPEQ